PANRGAPTGESVRARDVAGETDDAAVVYGVDAAGARPAGEQAENARARCEIEDDVARPDDFADGGVERADSDGIGEVLAVFVDDAGDGGIRGNLGPSSGSRPR